MKMQCNQIDVHVGDRVSRARVFRDIGLSELAEIAKMTSTALKSCESGTARFSPRELTRIAEYLHVELNFFFDGLTRTTKRQSTLPQLSLVASNGEPLGSDHLPRFDVGARRFVVAKV